MPLNTTTLDGAVKQVKNILKGAKPLCSIILGSGWGEITDSFTIKECIKYSDITYLGSPRVEGHEGKLVLAESANLEILIFQGRRHWYEGVGWEPIALPVYLTKQLGANAIVITNAAGGVRATLKAGDIMIIDDHINMMGTNPLIGPHYPALGPRFPDQTGIYDKSLRDLMDKAAEIRGIKINHGIYAAVTGPTYESPAEVAMYRAMGADAVGMSTAPEAIVANSIGLKVAGISCIANQAFDKNRPSISHDDVINVMIKTQPTMKKLITEFIRQFSYKFA